MTLSKDDIALIQKASTGEVVEFTEKPDNLELYSRILSQSSQWKVDAHRSEEEIFEQLTERLSDDKFKTTSKKSQTILLKRILGIAASLAMLLTASFLVINSINTVSKSSKVTELKEFLLPDGSKVTLNAASDLSYDKRDWEKGIRTLELSGQAYFEVSKGSKFTVNTSQGSVQVLGTSFNVYDRLDGFKVECFTGKVKVNTAYSESEVLLTKGLQTSLKRHTKKEKAKLEKPAEFHSEKRKEWLHGTFNFHNTPIRQVFDELERQFGVEVEFNEDQTRHYTGTFSKKDLNKALANICKPMGYRYELQDDKQILIIN